MQCSLEERNFTMCLARAVIGILPHNHNTHAAERAGRCPRKDLVSLRKGEQSTCLQRQMKTPRLPDESRHLSTERFGWLRYGSGMEATHRRKYGLLGCVLALQEGHELKLVSFCAHRFPRKQTAYRFIIGLFKFRRQCTTP